MTSVWFPRERLVQPYFLPLMQFLFHDTDLYVILIPILAADVESTDSIQSLFAMQRHLPLWDAEL